MSEESDGVPTPNEFPEDPAGPVSHANQLRGAAFKALLRRRKTWFWIPGFAVPILILFLDSPFSEVGQQLTFCSVLLTL